MSDVIGVPHRVPKVSIGAAYGDALLAGLGTGIIQKPPADQGDCPDPVRENAER